jgi:tricorn protease
MRSTQLPLAAALFVCTVPAFAQTQPTKFHIFQTPALSHDSIAFGYAGDLWTVPREGGRATRLTTGVGIESAPIFSPDGKTIAFTGEYDGNTDVFTIPAIGGVPHRVTYHPAVDIAVGWSPDSKRILFRSNRNATSRYTKIFSVLAEGGVPDALPLPMAYQGQLSPDASHIAYSPLAPAFGFDYASYVSWGHYQGGRASTIWVTSLPGLDSVEIPHEKASDFSPVYAGKHIFFLSARNGHTGIFRYDPASKEVIEALHNTGPDIRSLSSDGRTLAYDQLGELYLFDIATGKSHLVPIEMDADLPEVRPTIKNVAEEIDHVAISPTGLRAAIEAHGEILTVPVKHGPTRNLTNTPGVAERSPAWSPDGQAIAYFSDESGLYQLHIAPQTGGLPVKKFPLAADPAYYFDPQWSPDSKLIVFHDNRTNMYLLDTVSGKLTTLGDKNIFGGFSDTTYDIAFSSDSKWIAYPRSLPNHLHALYLYSVDTGKSTQLTSEMADSRNPAFDRGGKYLFFIASTNSGATSDDLDMTSDLYRVTSSVYAVVLAADQPSPVAPELEDEKTPTPTEPKKPEEKPAAPPKPVKVELAGIENRIVALPLPPAAYTGLAAGTKGNLYFLNLPEPSPIEFHGSILSRWNLEDRKTEKLAERILEYQLSADGEKMLLGILPPRPESGESGGGGGRPSWVIVPANTPVKPGEGTLSMADLQVRVNPPAEWAQMYHEVWRIERAYFYDPHFHGADTVADEKRFAPYVSSIASRTDLNYIFQEMLSAFSVGHLRGTGGAIPQPKHIPGGLLGVDYAIRNNRYCLEKIYTGGHFNPESKAPLAQPGLNLKQGDCILSINGQDITAASDIQQPLEGTANRAISIRVASADGTNPRDLTVVPIASEAELRNTDWIESNQRQVDELSGGKLAYVYLPNTGQGGFTNFNRYYFAQTQKQGAVIDERFNAGGQVADYIVEALGRKLESYWAPRYGAIEHTPNAAIYGPKVMIANEVSGSGGDALPWLFKRAKLGTLVGKRTWGGLVGISQIPVLMDGGRVTSPSVAFFSPNGEWDVENHGVDPDIEVEQDPKAVSEGHDPQLETAVKIALRELTAHPVPEPQRPAYPNYHK